MKYFPFICSRLDNVSLINYESGIILQRAFYIIH